MNISFKYIRILGLLLMLGGFSACNDDESDIPETGPANRTVLVYMMAEILCRILRSRVLEIWIVT